MLSATWTIYVQKSFLRLIHVRIRKKCEDGVEATQFGFPKGYGTNGAVFGVKTFLQGLSDHGRKPPPVS